ncbi:autotransporter outer membrane beta-barrel domain-containing protein [Salmonella enterica]|nr:autotransporter outer membrane beta-barrel domain-containing protein [Salmonella enterica]EGT0216963.1 autotransporter outer membrane beta-barrel domain-containing protein [Salmonella enterica]EHO2259431.1 autotransporter outer membrane beta-barrel domain-containing protein [Salmonella enterica]EJN9771215.1 autotransporter outer membrane beta-barrel domain-containing protein [Salmonella enterica]ELK3239166.1 autotransporter outer membrane beta-barrel domain-containing protein [Salmonella ent
MNKIYRVIWNSTLMQWVVTSEFGRARIKRAVSKSVMAAGLMAVLSAGAIAATTTYTPGTANNSGQAINVIDNGTYRLDGDVNFTGSTGLQSIYSGLIGFWERGYVTGPVNPNTISSVTYGSSVGISVTDPDTNITSTISTFNSDSIATTPGGYSSYWTIYEPTPEGSSPFIDAQIANVSGGGTFNMNASGTVGDTTVKDTVYIKVTDGTANWNSVNNILFGSAVSAQLEPRIINATSSTFNGTFTVTLADGSSVHQTVNNLADFKQYNTWLQKQIAAGTLGAGATAQANYDAAVRLAYTDTSVAFTVTPPSLDPDDPALIPFGEQVAMLADGQNAQAHVSSTGSMTYSSGGNAIVLSAVNGGTVINDGTVTTSGYQSYAMQAKNGGHIINNGVENIGIAGGYTPTGVADIYSGAGTTLNNYGTVNIGGFSVNAIANSWLDISSGAVATNNGAVNYGVSKDGTASSYIVPVVRVFDGGTFINAGKNNSVNGFAGVLYIGREASSDISSNPLLRGGMDVVHTSRAAGILAVGNSTVKNDGQIIIGSGFDGSQAISVSGTNVNVTVGADGVITDNGNYPVAEGTSPLRNAAIYSNATSGTVNNGGTINLNGANGAGLYVFGGGLASSSGAINAGESPLFATTGLRNYGIWSTGDNSRATLTGALNLTGDGAVGAYAENGGNVTISGNGAVNFDNGTNQLGYYVYGPTASITNNGTGAQDVSTEDSVLFRVDGGADFTGGAGAASVLTASGAGSTTVVANGQDTASGNVSAFNSGGMTLNLSGQDATGVVIQGGSQGKITSNATLNMTANGAVAGIADGQGYDINGKALGTPVAGVLANAALAAGAAGFGTGTLLVTEAALNSALDAITGYIARNGAEVSNAGNIVFTGEDTTGLLVEAGARGDNTGSITIGAGGTGIVAQDTTGANTTVVNTSGNIVLNGGSVANRTTGIIASGANTTVNMSGGTVTLNGNGATGVRASDGAIVNLSGTATPDFSDTATDQILFALSGTGSTINTVIPTGTVLDASGERSTLFRLEDGAAIDGDIQVAASGKDATALYATGDDTTAVIGNGSTLDISGGGATGVISSGGASGIIESGATLDLTGTGATAGIVDGNTYGADGSLTETGTGAELLNEATISSAVDSATAFIAKNGGTLENSGDIVLTGSDSTAVKVLGGEVDNSGNITANDTALYVGAGDQGQSSTISNSGAVLATDGNAAIELAAGSLNLVGSGTGTIEARGTADGVLVSTGATGLDVDRAHIVVNAAGATGNGIENAANLTNLQLTDTTIDVANGAGVRTAVTIDKANSGLITVSGNGQGIALENADGTTTTGNLDLSESSGLTINVTGAGGTGIYANTTGTVDTAASISVTNAAGGSALKLGSGVTAATNRGILSSFSTAAPTVDTANATTFTNAATGVITASASGTPTLAMSAANATMNNAGLINGDVVMNGANATVNNTGTVSNNITTSSGNNAVTVDSGLVGGNIALNGSGTNAVLLKNSSEVNTVSGSAGTDTVTILGNGNTFNALNGGSGTATAVFDGVTAGFHMNGTGAQINNYNQVNLRNGSLFSLDNGYSLDDKPSGGAAFDVDATSVLTVNSATDRTFTNKLTGTGTVDVDNGGTVFGFATTTGSAFAGTVDMNNATFALGGVNTSALTSATLKANSGSITTVADGEQVIGGLTFASGEVEFNGTAPDQKVATSHVTVNTLDASGTGTVQINVPAPYVPGYDTATTASLMTQDDANIGLGLVSATAVTGSGGNLSLQDQNGNVITDATLVDIAQGGSTVAKGTYDYRLTTAGATGSQDGLYVNYGLKELELLQDQTLTLAGTPGTTGAAADQSARITGSGNLAVSTTGSDVLSLSNSGNDYTGDTTVLSGTLRTDVDGALGDTATLAINSDAKADLNGTAQTAGELAGDVSSVLDINGGSLSLTNGGYSNGSLTGSGKLNVDGGVLSIDGANISLSTTTTISSGAEVVISDAQGAGTGDIADEGTLTLDSVLGMLANSISGSGNVDATNSTNATVAGDNSAFSGLFNIDSGSNLTVSEQNNLGTAAVNDNGLLTVNTGSDWTLSNSVSSSGGLAKSGTGTLTLTADSAAYTGTTDINAGELALGSGAASAVDMASGLVNVRNGGSFTGYGSTAGDVNIMQGGTMQMSDFLVGGSLTNSGSVLLTREDGTPGNTLTVNGNYTGNNGLLAFNTELGDDSSATDKLTVQGNTAGNTRVSVTNTGGTGAQTVNGIEVIEVNGTSAGNFALTTGTVEAGAYVYTLAKGTGDAAKNWYLTSKWNGGTPEDGGSVDPVPPVDPIKPPVVDPTAPDALRPEAGSYISNIAAANTLFNHRLHDRLGEPQYTDALRNGDDNATSMWMRHVGGHERSSAGDGQLKTQSNRYVLQIGGEIAQWSSDDLDRWHLGVMGGYANEHSNTRSDRVGYGSDGRVSGYSAGLYGTWYQNDADKTGMYVDSWMLYNWFDSSVESDNRDSDSYKSKGLTASLEAGYTLKAGEFTGSQGTLNTWYVQPQAQVTWMGVKDDAHTRHDGTRIETEGDGNIQTRLGVRTYLNSHHKMDDGKQRTFQPFVEVNWIHNTEAFGVKMDGTKVSRDGARNLGEVRTGVEGKLNDRLSVWGNVGVQMGDNGYSDTQGMLGVKYSW